MKAIAITILLVTSSILAAEHVAPKYPVVTQGRKVSFDEIRRSDLGKVASIYCRPGRPEAIGGVGSMPEGAFTHVKKTKINVWTGELHSILKDGLTLIWYYDDERTSASTYGASEDDIDFILFKE